MDPQFVFDAAAIRTRYLAVVEKMARDFERQQRPLVIAIVWAILLALILSVVGIPLAIFSLVRMRRMKQRRQRKKAELAIAAEFAKRSQFVIAYPLMINSSFFQPGTAPACGLVLMSLDPTVSHEEMLQLAAAVGSRGAEGWSAEDRARVQTLMADTRFQKHRRRMISKTVTGGKTIYACDVTLWREFLPGGKVTPDCPYIPSMAEPGEAGRIMQLAWWIVADEPAPSEHDAGPWRSGRRRLTIRSPSVNDSRS